MKLIKLFIFSLLIVSCNSKTNSVDTTESNIDNSSNNEIVESVNENEQEKVELKLNNCYLTTKLDADTLFLFKRTSNRIDTLKSIYPLEDGEYIEEYKFFRHNDNYFFKAQITMSGTGYFNFDYLFYIDTLNCSIKEVKIEYASDYYRSFLKEDQGIWKGESRLYTDSIITSGFSVWNDTDANCCPSVGTVYAEYIIEKINESFIMHQDTCIFTEN